MKNEAKATWKERSKAMAMVSFPAIWPFLNFLNTNRNENYSELRLGLYGLGTLMVVWICFLSFRLVLSKTLSWHRAAAIFAVCVISVFCYSITYSLAHELWQGYYLKTWAAFTVVMVLLAWLWSRSPLFQNLIFILGGVLAVVPAAEYLVYQVQLSAPVVKDMGKQVMAVLPENTDNLPSVYHIILDEYGREDVLRNLYGFDNTDYLEKLARRGFYVADKSMSNYRRSGLSVPSTMAMDYMFQGDATPQVMEAAKRHLNGGGPVFEWFRDAGYFSALLRFSGAYCEPGSPDYCFPAGAVLFGELESNLIALTPLNSFIDFFIGKMSILDRKSYHLWDAQNFIAGLKTEKPVFAHIHMLIPHSPYQFTSTCEPISLAQQKANKDSSKNYINHLKCGNIASLELVDTILQRDPDAIIVLQADHGPREGVNWTDWKTDDTWEQSFSILNAWRIPPSLDCRKELHPELTLVNTFRIIQGCLSSTPPDLLPERWFDEDKTNNRHIEIFRKYPGSR